MYGHQFYSYSTWRRMLKSDLANSQNAICGGLQPRTEAFYAELYAEGVPPRIVEIKAWATKDPERFMDALELEQEQVLAAKRGRGREAYNQIAA